MNRFIFDVDGTLTPSRGEIDHAFFHWFSDFCLDNSVFIVTGGSKAHTIEQIGIRLWNLAERVYQCSGNEVWMYGKMIRQNEISVSNEMQQFFDKWLAESKFKLRSGKHVDIRPGLINFSIIGRGCTREQRHNYVIYESLVNERKIIAQEFNEKFSPQFTAQVAGETGIDITLTGKDKSQIISDFDEEDLIHFFGDKMEVGGNDYSLAQEVLNRNGKVYHVRDWRDTWNILRSL